MWKKAFKSLKSTSDTKLVSRRPQYYLSQCEISLSTSPHRAKSLTALHKAKYLSQLLYIGPNISINYLKQGKISLTSDTSWWVSDLSRSGCYILVKFLTQGKISLSSNINKPVSQGPHSGWNSCLTCLTLSKIDHNKRPQHYLKSETSPSNISHQTKYLVVKYLLSISHKENIYLKLSKISYIQRPQIYLTQAKYHSQLPPSGPRPRFSLNCITRAK